MRRIRLCSCLAVFSLLMQSAPLVSSQESSSKARHSASSQASKVAAKPATLDPGTLRDGVYRNAGFGFSYKLPVSWVDRTEDMRPDSSQQATSQVLLSAFSRPPEAAGDSVDAAVIIAAESVSAYPGLKHAVEYFEPLTQATTSKGFKVVNEPYEYSIGPKVLVRSDFSKEDGPTKMFQSSLVMIEKGYVVSFTVVAATEDEAGDLLRNLTFAVGRAGSNK